MLSVFGALNSGLLRRSAVNIDNNVCKLHYRATFVLLVAFSLLVTSRQFIGDPIKCMTSSTVPQNVLETYCWISTTFTLPQAFSKRVGIDVPHPGIDKYKPGDERTYHQYYQWVCFVLFLQAVMFYVPHYLWKMWEGGRLKSLVGDLNSPIIDYKDKESRKEALVSYFRANLHNHNLYFWRFFLCEILNFVNVVGQIYFTDHFLGGEFTTYGSDVIAFTESDPENRTDPMVKIFPRVTKCTFHHYGSSGDVQKVDALCLLPINIINEKVYVFLWFWFIIISVVSGIQLAYRLVLLAFPTARFFLLRMSARVMDSRRVEALTHKSQVGDWFLLYQMSKNMDGQIFGEFLSQLGSNLDSHSTSVGNGNGNAAATLQMKDIEFRHSDSKSANMA